MDQIVDIRHAATILGRSRRWVYERARRGQLPGARKIGKRWFILTGAIHDYLRGGKIEDEHTVSESRLVS